MLLDGQKIEAIQAKNGKRFAGLTQLNFRIDYRAEGGEWKFTILGKSGFWIDFLCISKSVLLFCEKKKGSSPLN